MMSNARMMGIALLVSDVKPASVSMTQPNVERIAIVRPARSVLKESVASHPFVKVLSRSPKSLRMEDLSR